MIKALLWFIAIDVPLAILRVIVVLFGPLIVAIALPFPKTKKGIRNLPAWAKWWGNPTYGVYGNKSYQTDKAYNPFFADNPKGFMSQWYWLAIRNPANGLVESPLFSFQQAGSILRHWGCGHIDNGVYGWQFVTAKRGWRRYTGYYGMFPYCPWFDFELRIGFKILPAKPDRKRSTGMTFIINPFKRAAVR